MEPLRAEAATRLPIVSAGRPSFRADVGAPAGRPCRECGSVLIVQLLCCDFAVWFPDVMRQVFGPGEPSAKGGDFKEYSENLW